MTAIDKLRRCGLVLLVVDVPRSRMLDEDGNPLIFAHDEDLMLEALEWCTMSGIRVTRDPLEPYQAVLVVLTEGWRRSTEVTRAILRARRAKQPLFFLDPRNLSLKPA